MGNPLPDLQGWADPSDPNWKSNVMARVNANEKRKERNARQRAAAIQIHFDVPFKTMLNMAARKRGMTMASYVRRAVGSRIAADLGVEFADVMVHCPAVTTTDLPIKGDRFPHKPTYDDGEGFGSWEVTSAGSG